MKNIFCLSALWLLCLLPSLGFSQSPVPPIQQESFSLSLTDQASAFYLKHENAFLQFDVVHLSALEEAWVQSIELITDEKRLKAMGLPHNQGTVILALKENYAPEFLALIQDRKTD